MTAKLLDRSALLLATLGLAGKAYDVPSKQFWNSLVHGHGYVPLVLLGLAGVFGALTPFESYYKRSMLDRNVTIRRRILAGVRSRSPSGRTKPAAAGSNARRVWATPLRWMKVSSSSIPNGASVDAWLRVPVKRFAVPPGRLAERVL